MMPEELVALFCGFKSLDAGTISCSNMNSPSCQTVLLENRRSSVCKLKLNRKGCFQQIMVLRTPTKSTRNSTLKGQISHVLTLILNSFEQLEQQEDFRCYSALFLL